MRIIRKIFLFIFFLLLSVFVLVYFYCQMQKPLYSGTQEMPDLDSAVVTYFDNYGVPHIYAKTEVDAYKVLGYIHAKERLFQMELIRRVSAGRLSEIFGNKTVEADKFFRMLGLNRRADTAAAEFMRNTDIQWKKDVLAYLEGVNQYVDKRRKRVEFLLLGIPKENFSVKDVYLIIDFMAFNFQMGFKTDPLMSRIKKQWGEKYIADLGLKENVAEIDTTGELNIDSLMTVIDDELPVRIWTGSNSWAVSAERSKSGKVLFENDTHVGVQQPAVWYESHIEYPGFGIYGSFLPGFPFPVLGHTRQHAWGLTVLENDDLDFFSEHVDSSDTSVVIINNCPEKIKSYTEFIKVKDSTDILLQCRSTSHGPVCSDVIPEFSRKNPPVSACWTLLKFPPNLPEASYNMACSQTMEEFRNAISMIAAPGLNIIYGDVSDNIAWYTAAKFVKRRAGINPNTILDGSGSDDWLGYYDFSENPYAENPSREVVLSANNPPLTDSIHNFPGYYVPADRSIRINQFFHSKKVFSIRDMQQINTDEWDPLESTCRHASLSIL